MNKLRAATILAVILAALSIGYRTTAHAGQASGASVLKGYYPMAMYATGSTGNVIPLQSDGTNLLMASGAGFGAAPLSLKGYYPAVLYAMNAGAPIPLQADATGSLKTTPPLSATFSNVSSDAYNSNTICNSNTTPAACGFALAGRFVLPAGSTSIVVNNANAGANSEIFIQQDNSIGASLSVTCNTTYAAPVISARSAGVSFTVATAVAPTTNPVCYSYHFLN